MPRVQMRKNRLNIRAVERAAKRQCKQNERQTKVSYTESYRDLQESYQTVQQSYRTRKFGLACSISAPVRSSIHQNGTYPTLKNFLLFFNDRSFKGVEAPEGCKNVASIFTTFLPRLKICAAGA
jgi:hypothetical protein